jgi:hypothetical protein
MAVKAWMFPPVVGYNTEVSQGAVKTLSAFNFANLTAKTCYLSLKPPHLFTQFTWREREREREPLTLRRCYSAIEIDRINPII